MSEREVSGPTPALSPAINQRLQESERSLNWVHSKLDGMNIPQLPDDKQAQPCGGVLARRNRALDGYCRARSPNASRLGSYTNSAAV